MPPLPGLSVELWQTILRHSISVPGFLDPDVFEGDLHAVGFGDRDATGTKEGVYWAAEKTRTILRGVCRSWNEYLLTFEHRFVRMSDIMHRKIDEISLKKAIRISFTPHICSCCEICVPIPGDGYFGAFKRFTVFCCKTIWSFSRLPAEIIELRGGPVESLWNSLALRSLTQVKVVISFLGGGGMDYPIFSQMPNLNHMHGQIYDDLAYLQFISHTLVTVSFKLNREKSYETLIFDLPSLRHLRIDYGHGVASLIFFERVLVPLLQKVGNQLRSLYIGSWDQGCQMPIGIWKQCPQLEKIHPGMRIAPPSVPHPIHTLSVLPDHVSSTLLLQWPNLQTLIFDGRWRRCRYEQLNDLLTLWTRTLKGRGATFKDLDSVTLEESMEVRGLDSVAF